MVSQLKFFFFLRGGLRSKNWLSSSLLFGFLVMYFYARKAALAALVWAEEGLEWLAQLPSIVAESFGRNIAQNIAHCIRILMYFWSGSTFLYRCRFGQKQCKIRT